MNKQRIVLAYSGTLAGTGAIAWLRDRHGADVVTLTVDVGQTEDLEEVRARALASGAVRAHVVDARDAFALESVIPALRDGTADPARLRRLPDAIIARTLAEIARVESGAAVAHASAADAAPVGEALARALARAGLALPVLAPAIDCAAPGLAGYARQRGLPGPAARREPHLLVRRAADPAAAPAAAAQLEFAFADDVPCTLNGVPMTLPELIESVSLIAGQYGLGHGEPWPMPGAGVLRAAYAMRGDRGGARVAVSAGAFAAIAPAAATGRTPVGAGALAE